MNSRIKTLRTELATLTNQAKTLYAEMENTPAEKRSADDVQKLDNLIAAGESKRAELQRLETIEANDEAANSGAGERKSRDGMSPRRRTLGDLVVQSETYKNLGANPKSMPRVEVKADEIVGVTGISNTQAFPVAAERLAEIFPKPRIGLDLLDILASGQTNSNSIEYVSQVTRTNNAAETQELSSKPQSVLDWNLVTAPVRTIATYVITSRQVLEDEPRLRGLIDDELMFMVRQRLQTQLLAGDGTGVNLTGLLNTSNIQTRVHATSGARFDANDKRADTLRRAITDIKLAFHQPDGILMNPADAEDLEIEKATGTGNYLAAYDPIAARVWRVPVIEHAVITAGTVLVGNFSMGAKWFMRNEVTVEAGVINDQFIKNQFTILAELRAALTVPYPDAFEKITGF
jgi:HK97 family phage major capsid protein